MGVVPVLPQLQTARVDRLGVADLATGQLDARQVVQAAEDVGVLLAEFACHAGDAVGQQFFGLVEVTAISEEQGQVALSDVEVRQIEELLGDAERTFADVETAAERHLGLEESLGSSRDKCGSGNQRTVS